MSINAISYGEFSQKFHNSFKGRRAPLQVTLEVTRRCPLECRHCYNNLAMSDLNARKAELTKEEYAVLLSDLAEMGAFWLLFTGGEIFARKDFVEIYRFAKEKGFLVTLFTNGILINEKIADFLREIPPFAIEITLYGRTKATYETLTGVPGSFDRCMRGIQLLLDRGLPLKLKTVGTSINKHEVVAMKDFAERELGLEFKFDSQLSPRIDCSRAPLGVRLSPEEVVAIDMHWPKVAGELRTGLQREVAGPPLGNRSSLYQCGGGVQSCAIDPYGQMSICVLSHRQTYDIRSGSVREGWEKFLLETRTQEPKNPPTKCTKCRIRSVCSMCPANGELENGDPESPVDFLCEVAHLRALALGFPIPEHGDCELCNDARRRAEVHESARRISQQEINPQDWVAPQTALPVLNQMFAGEGCGGCGWSH
jgi:radical SAM protein with 4Fe4S-binding SPASM domain